MSHLPSIEKIRFVSSGTEAVMSALRLARGVTGRKGIVKFTGCYHGHSDSLLIRAGSSVSYLNSEATSLGIPQETIQHTFSLPYNDLSVSAFLRVHGHEIAAVVVEPIAGNMGVVPASAAFLSVLREETKRHGIVLIFDEVMTGFRVGLGGAQGLYGIEPDLTCLGKIIGGGLPAAAFGGRAVLMDHLAPLGGVYQAGTLSGNPIAMAAGLETLTQVTLDPLFYPRLEEKTRLLTLPIQEAIERRGLPACLQQSGSMFTLFLGKREVQKKEELDQALFRRFFTALFHQGIYIPPSPYEAWFVSSAHTEESLGRTRDAILDYFS